MPQQKQTLFLNSHGKYFKIGVQKKINPKIQLFQDITQKKPTFVPEDYVWLLLYTAYLKVCS
jgi:hypothetical protein